MKKTILLSLLMLVALATMAQTKSLLLSERFDATTWPDAWTIQGEGLENWSISKTNNAGCEANEAKLYWMPEFEDVSRLVSPPIDLTGFSSVVLEFSHYLMHYAQGGIYLGAATSSDGGVTWNNIWEQQVYGPIGTTTSYLTVNTSDVGNDNVQFCLFFSGRVFYIEEWNIDNIFVYALENLDLKANKVSMPSIAKYGAQPISFEVTNYGTTPISTFEASYIVNDSEPVIETFTANLSSLDRQTFSFAELPLLIGGEKNIKVEILSVNGADDDDLTNNSAQKVVNVKMGDVQRYPLVENFTSSTYLACSVVNPMLVEMENSYPGQLTIIKYPMNYPSTGDPYFTEECLTRYDFYGAYSLCLSYLDGVDAGVFGVEEDRIETQINTPAYFDIRGSFQMNGSQITIKTDVMSYIDFDYSKLNIAVNEKVTHGNVGTNGETSFRHIMMKMLNDANGNEFSIGAGEIKTFEFTYDMSTTFVEELSDLEVVAFVQNSDTKKVFNSANLLENTDFFPYAPENLEMIFNEDNNTMNVTWQAPANGNPTGYKVLLNDEVILPNTSELSYTFDAVEGEYYVVRVQALYDAQKTSVYATQGIIAAHSTNVTEQTTPCKVFPNPANESVTIAAENMSKIRVYNVLGALETELKATSDVMKIETGRYQQGVYFLNVEFENGSTAVKKLVIRR